MGIVFTVISGAS